MLNAVALVRSGLLLFSLLLSNAALGTEQRKLETLLEELRTEMAMPGLRAAVRWPDGRILRGAVGLADEASAKPLDDDTVMPGGSTGKTFVAALTMLLIEDGVLALDDPVKKWLGALPWFARLPNADDMQIRHLLSHSSGIGDYPATLGFQLSMIWRVLRHGSAKYEPEELINFVLDKRPAFPVGEGFEYTDAGYLVLGLVIEASTGAGYYKLLEDRILKPQALEQIRPQNQSVLRNTVTGYMGGSSVFQDDGRMKFDPTSEWTGGGLLTNPTVLVRFYGALAEGSVVAPSSYVKMTQEGWRDPEVAHHYGYGLFVYANGARVGHGGMWPGYRSRVAHYSDAGVTIAIQTNRDGRVDMYKVIQRIAALYAGKVNL